MSAFSRAALAVLTAVIFTADPAFAKSQDELFLEAQKAFKNVQYATAIHAYEAAAAAAPASDTALRAEYEIARSFYYQWDIDTAITRFTDFVSKHSTHALAPRAQKWIGDAHVMKNRPDEALTAYAALVRLYPGDALVAETKYAIGKIYARKKEWQKAIEEFESVLSGQPSSWVVPQVKEALKRAQEGLSTGK